MSRRYAGYGTLTTVGPMPQAGVGAAGTGIHPGTTALGVPVLVRSRGTTSPLSGMVSPGCRMMGRKVCDLPWNLG